MTRTSQYLISLCLLTLNLYAQEEPTRPLFDQNSLSLVLGGNGALTTKGQSMSIFGANVSIVQTGFLLLPFQAGLRQTFSHQAIEGFPSIDIYTTRVFYDFIFPTVTKRLDLAAGFNVGPLYGDTKFTWQAGPEVGLRWWIRPTAAIIARVDYPFDLNRGRAYSVINYFIGFQVKLETKTK